LKDADRREEKLKVTASLPASADAGLAQR